MGPPWKNPGSSQQSNAARVRCALLYDRSSVTEEVCAMMAAGSNIHKSQAPRRAVPCCQLNQRHRLPSAVLSADGIAAGTTDAGTVNRRCSLRSPWALQPESRFRAWHLLPCNYMRRRRAASSVSAPTTRQSKTCRLIATPAWCCARLSRTVCENFVQTQLRHMSTHHRKAV